MSNMRPGLLFRQYCHLKIPLPRPEAPPDSACCGQGCVNCVWLEYGYKLIDYYSQKNKEKALLDVEKRVDDPNIKAFVLSELQMRWRSR